MSFSFTLTGAVSAQIKLYSQGIKAPGAAAQAMYEAAEEVFTPAARQNLINNKSVFTKKIYNNIKARIVNAGQKNASVEWGVFNVKYAGRLEEGQGPFNPSYPLIYRWYSFKNPKLSDKQVSAGAKAVTASIRTFGVKPHPFLGPAVSENSAKFKAAFDRKLRERFSQ